MGYSKKHLCFYIECYKFFKLFFSNSVSVPQTYSGCHPHNFYEIYIMANDLAQDEADMLLKVEKHREDDRSWRLPDLGGDISVPLLSFDGRESFSLDVSRGRINLIKGKFQARARTVIVLARLNFGVPHRNPDGEEVGAPHLHLYREGYGDKWAYPVPIDLFPNLESRWQTLFDFLAFINAAKRPPLFDRGLFS
jgi:hypothetical protein